MHNLSPVDQHPIIDNQACRRPCLCCMYGHSYPVLAILGQGHKLPYTKTKHVCESQRTTTLHTTKEPGPLRPTNIGSFWKPRASTKRECQIRYAQKQNTYVKSKELQHYTQQTNLFCRTIPGQRQQILNNGSMYSKSQANTDDGTWEITRQMTRHHNISGRRVLVICRTSYSKIPMEKNNRISTYLHASNRMERRCSVAHAPARRIQGMGANVRKTRAKHGSNSLTQQDPTIKRWQRNKCREGSRKCKCKNATVEPYSV